MACSSERCISLVKGLEQRRRRLGSQTLSRPRIVWEPIPELCAPGELENMKLASKMVDIVSPNAEELAAFFLDNDNIRTQSQMADLVLASAISVDGNGALLVREGSDGATVYTRQWSVHLPAYHRAATPSSKVLDPTGGGNAYLGALAMAMSEKVEPELGSFDYLLASTFEALRKVGPSAGTLLYAAIYATIAASYVIEQAGMPSLSVSANGEETWNGETAASRLGTYLSREKDSIAESLRFK